MTELNSTGSPRQRKPKKPKKPSKDFPLFPHATGQWAKKVKGRMFYFGAWSDPQAALNKWLDEKDDLLAGRVPRCRTGVAGVPTLRELVNRFLTTKAILRDSGELSPYTWLAYHQICDELITAFGRERQLTDITTEDFDQLRGKWSKKWGAQRLAAETNRARTVFNFAFKVEMVEKPIRFGENFRKPSKKVMRLDRAARGSRMFEAAELRSMLDAARQPMKAMILLGINCGFGNNDVGMLTMTAIDLDGGWVEMPRPKTGIMRRCPLWPETITALREWLEQRPNPKNEADADLVFLTKYGNAWGKDLQDRPITHQCRKLLDKLKINGSRNFYALRHTFETIGGESRDQVAVDAIMGHDDGSMGNVYRERISAERLQAVAEHVRAWLLAKPEKGEGEAPRLKFADGTEDEVGPAAG